MKRSATDIFLKTNTESRSIERLLGTCPVWQYLPSHRRELSSQWIQEASDECVPNIVLRGIAQWLINTTVRKFKFTATEIREHHVEVIVWCIFSKTPQQPDRDPSQSKSAHAVLSQPKASPRLSIWWVSTYWLPEEDGCCTSSGVYVWSKTLHLYILWYGSLLLFVRAVRVRPRCR